jgi:hypothetical protein
MRKILIALLVVFVGLPSLAQDKNSQKYGNQITKESLYGHLSVLAHDSLEGRDTGAPGQKKAAAYIAKHFESYGLKPIVPTKNGMSYLQTFTLHRAYWGDVNYKIGNKTFKNGVDMVFQGSVPKSMNGRGDIVFVGKGDDADLAGLNLSGKTAMLYSVGTNPEAKVNALKEKGAVAVMVVNTKNDDDFNTTVGRLRNFVNSRRLSFPSTTEVPTNLLWIVSPSQASSVTGKPMAELERLVDANASAAKNAWASMKPVRYTFNIQRIIEDVTTENVLGFLEGTDLKDEVIVLTAHYDHIGVNANGEINNGADDDGSGTSAIIDMAKAFTDAAKAGIRPRRSILFMPVTGEEKGLLGSRYYADMDPIIPHDKIVVNLNIDMIGRADDEHMESGDKNYLYIIGSEFLSSELKIINDYANITYTNLNLDYRYDAPDDPNRFYFRSDHYSFAKYNTPVIFYFNGVHPDYHRPGDTIEKIEWEAFVKRTRLVFHTAWEIAHRDRKPVVDKVMEERLTQGR